MRGALLSGPVRPRSLQNLDSHNSCAALGVYTQPGHQVQETHAVSCQPVHAHGYARLFNLKMLEMCKLLMQGRGVQDAHAAVRQRFGQKVARCVEVFCRPSWSNVRAGKYAAMLPLAAMDPLPESQQVHMLAHALLSVLSLILAVPAARVKAADESILRAHGTAQPHRHRVCLSMMALACAPVPWAFVCSACLFAFAGRVCSTQAICWLVPHHSPAASSHAWLCGLFSGSWRHHSAAIP